MQFSLIFDVSWMKFVCQFFAVLFLRCNILGIIWVVSFITKLHETLASLGKRLISLNKMDYSLLF